ncbi:MAG: methylated-DNA--[protein]-cysteine S-methyltransferase [Opitutaceae bacterium]|jgi:methylated-DNA-[protein]-cysteine S-methyltransferase|nr:methylated-DNA--[protein]-cysteine S-methyltransferase [Opitutaceae bacterium]
MKHYYDTFTLPIAGVFSVALDNAGNVVATAFGDVGSLRERLGDRLGDGELIRDSARARDARWQIEEYFSGDRREFSLPLKPAGTPHQRRVWAALRAIPFGGTRSYGQLARTLRSSARAVGRANGANPIALIVPCHRVIGADGSLTGFAFGTNLKRKLLAHEGVEPWASELV